MHSSYLYISGRKGRPLVIPAIFTSQASEDLTSYNNASESGCDSQECTKGNTATQSCPSPIPVQAVDEQRGTSTKHGDLAQVKTLTASAVVHCGANDITMVKEATDSNFAEEKGADSFSAYDNESPPIESEKEIDSKPPYSRRTELKRSVTSSVTYVKRPGMTRRLTDTSGSKIKKGLDEFNVADDKLTQKCQDVINVQPLDDSNALESQNWRCRNYSLETRDSLHSSSLLIGGSICEEYNQQGDKTIRGQGRARLESIHDEDSWMSPVHSIQANLADEARHGDTHIVSLQNKENVADSSVFSKPTGVAHVHHTIHTVFTGHK